MREKRVLLAFIKAVNFIHEQNCTPTCIAVLTRTLNGLTNFFHTRGDRRNAFNICISVASNHFGECCFTRTGWSPQDHGVQVPCLNGTRQGLACGQQMLLADILC